MTFEIGKYEKSRTVGGNSHRISEKRYVVVKGERLKYDQYLHKDLTLQDCTFYDFEPKVDDGLFDSDEQANDYIIQFRVTHPDQFI